MKTIPIVVRPHGSQIKDSHTDHIRYDWPAEIRLPVPGDHIVITEPDREISGPCKYVRFEMDARREPLITVKLGSYLEP